MAESPKKLAVVVFNLGGPDKLSSVRPFLFRLFYDPAIIGLPWIFRLIIAGLISCLRASSAKKNYAMMGGKSPLLEQTRAQAEKLSEYLTEGLGKTFTVKVFISMRYWHPFARETARDIALFQPDEIVCLPLYPQYSLTTTGSSFKSWDKSYKGSGRVHKICCYPTATAFVTSHVNRILDSWNKAGRPSNLKLLFSAHGLPEKIILSGDPYQQQIEKTVASVVSELVTTTKTDWDWQICFQSRVGPLKWIGPSTQDALKEASKAGSGVMVVPIAFVSEHVETLVELDIEYGHLAKTLGIDPYIRVKALSLEPDYIKALGEAVVKALEVSEICPFQSSVCSKDRTACPKQHSESKSYVA